MSVSKHTAFAILAFTVGFAGIELGTWVGLPMITGVVAPAEARVGRPLTPVSVAGVGRRTVRRCAVGVYNC